MNTFSLVKIEMGYERHNSNESGVRTQITRMFPLLFTVIQSNLLIRLQKELKFTGLARYYERFIPRLAEMSKPLTRLLKKEADVKRDWDEAADQAVADIKEAFSHSLVMAQFDPTKDLLVQTDASNFALGAVLCHVEGEGADRKEYPIMFASKTLNKQQMNYSVTEKECLAVVWALD